MKVSECEIRANEVQQKYNPHNLSPFPYKNISDDKTDLDILVADLEGEPETPSISGAIVYGEETGKFSIIINGNKPKTRQNFTVAHELGHYFLHSELLKTQKIIVDDDNHLENKRILYRLDVAQRNQIEIEANNFAAALLMPRNLVFDAWNRISDIQECAKIFGVSTIAMTIRLERLGLID